MSTLTIDTHKIVERLLRQGFSKEQAEGLVEALTEIDLLTRNEAKDILATKRDLDHLRLELYKAFLIHGLAVVGAILAAAKLL